VSIGKESLGIFFNLADVEAVGGILSVGQQASLERTLLAAHSAANTIANIDGVREGDSGRPRGTLGSLMDVCGCCGRRLVLAAEAVDFDVVADQVQLAVDTDLEEARGTGEATGGSCAVDDLVGGSLDFIVRGEGEGRARHLGSLGTFGRCCGATLGVVDRTPAARGSRVRREVCTSALGVINGFPTALIRSQCQYAIISSKYMV
jgi:hypothetical protein